MSLAAIEWSPKAREFLRKLPKNVANRIFTKVDAEIRLNPRRYLEPLVGIDAKKIRVGHYRLFVDYDGEHLVILAIRHRRDAYKNH